MNHPLPASMKSPRDRRPSVWKGGVLQIWVTRACDKTCFGCTQGSNLSGKPGMITPEQFEQACASLAEYWGVIGMFGGNPCLAKGTRVLTQSGIVAIEELEGRVFSVRNLRGEYHKAICVYRGKKPLWRIRLRGGIEYLATAEHEWPALSLAYEGNHKRKDLPRYNPRKTVRPLGKIQTQFLTPGMRLPVLKSQSLAYGHDGDRSDGFLAGWLLGDGWLSKKHEPRTYIRRCRNQYVEFDREFTTSRVRRIGLIVNGDDHDSGIAVSLSDKLRRLGSDAKFRSIKGCHELQTGSNRTDEWLDRFGIVSKADGAPSAIWSTASEEFRIGFLDGIFSSDGHVEISKQRGYARVRLTTAHRKLASDVSDLLGFYGIKNSVKARTRINKFGSGAKSGKKLIAYELSVDGTASVEHFSSLIRLSSDKKRERLESAAGRHSPDIESANIEIVSVEKTELTDDVWDISVGDDTHCFQLSHCITGNCIHPQFPLLCEIFREHIPRDRRGLWSNNLNGHGRICRKTFNPSVSNLNVHLDRRAYDEMKRDWPECHPVGLESDSRHSPPFVAMQDVIADEEERWRLIGECDVNQFWSAMIGVFRGELRGWFCELAGAQAMLHQHEPDYPDTGLPVVPGWWDQPMAAFDAQVRLHCHACGIPLRGHGELAVGGKVEQVSKTHLEVYRPKQKGREVQQVMQIEELRRAPEARSTDYLQKAGAE